MRKYKVIVKEVTQISAKRNDGKKGLFGEDKYDDFDAYVLKEYIIETDCPRDRVLNALMQKLTANIYQSDNLSYWMEIVSVEEI